MEFAKAVAEVNQLSGAVIRSDDSTHKVIVNRWVLATLTAMAGTIVGLAPVILVTGRRSVLPYFLGGMVVLAVSHFILNHFSDKQVHTTASYPPTFLEILLAGLSTVSAWALSGLMWFISYLLLWLLFKLLVQTGLVGNFNYEAIAFWGTLFFVVLLGVGVFIASIDEMIAKLYPGTAGVRSAFYDLAVRRRRWLVIYLLIGTVVLVFLALVTYLITGTIGAWFYIFLQFYLFITTSGLSAGEPPGQRRKDSSDPAIEAVGKLLTNLGYKIIPQPKVGDQEIDPFLINLDLLAHNDQRALAIEIKTPKESPEPVEWTVASSLRMTALTISPELEKLGINTGTIEIFLVLNDRKPSPSLINFSNTLKQSHAQGAIHIVELPTDKINEILATNDGTILENVAREIGLSGGHMEATAPSISPSQAAGGGELA